MILHIGEPHYQMVGLADGNENGGHSGLRKEKEDFIGLLVSFCVAEVHTHY